MATAIAGARTRVTVPPVTVARRGILSVATVVPVSGHELLGAEYLTDACTIDYGTTSAWCPPAPSVQCGTVTATVDPKVFTHHVTDVVEGDPFTIYAGAACDIDTVDERRMKAERQLEFAEAAAIDAAMLPLLDAVDMPTGVTGSIVCAIGAMEAALAEVYGGEGVVVIPMKYACAAYGEGAVYRDLDGTLRTCLGTLVAAYIAPLTVDAVYATGRITLLQGPVKSYSVPPMNRADGTCLPARGLAERTYVPLVECLVLSGTATCCDCPAVTP